MKKFIGKLVLFIIFMLIANFIFLKTIQSTEWNFKKAKYIHTLKNQEVDILFIGSSLSFDAFDAKVLENNNINTYNLALAGANLKTSTIQLENYLKHNKPKNIFLGLSSCVTKYLDKGEVLPVVDYYYSKPKLSYRELPMIKFRWLANEVLKIMTSKVHRDAYVYNGQFRTNKITPDLSEYPPDMTNEFNYARYENSIYLMKLDSICHAHKINLVCAEMPGSKKTQNAVPIGPFNYTSKQGQTRQIYNFNNYEFAKLFDANKDWLTTSHFNVSGSKKFTEELLKRGFFK